MQPGTFHTYGFVVFSFSRPSVFFPSPILQFRVNPWPWAFWSPGWSDWWRLGRRSEPLEVSGMLHRAHAGFMPALFVSLPVRRVLCRLLPLVTLFSFYLLPSFWRSAVKFCFNFGSAHGKRVGARGPFIWCPVFSYFLFKSGG